MAEGDDRGVGAAAQTTGEAQMHGPLEPLLLPGGDQTCAIEGGERRALAVGWTAAKACRPMADRHLRNDGSHRLPI